jgi:2-phosphosulfolactate phosphatase
VKFDQSAWPVRCEWGLRGIETLAPSSAVVIIVDILSFTTAVDVAVERGAAIFPYPLKGEAAARYAVECRAELASADRASGYSLSPSSLSTIGAGSRLVLPSPNGARLAHAALGGIVLAACLRNARAVAEFARSQGETVAVIPAGEIWDDGSPRVSFEDLLGAGAVISALPGAKSPESRLAAAAFEALRPDLGAALRGCGSGLELIERGFLRDIELAVQLNVSRAVPLLNRERAFVRAF